MKELRDAKRYKRPTVEDVAAHAEVAVGTVSRFLNGAKLRKTNQEKIARAIEDLGFRRNAGASRIHKRHTQIIGMLVPVLNQFFAEFTAKVSDMLLEHGFLLIPVSKGVSESNLYSAMQYFVDQGIDALILSGDADLYEHSRIVRQSGLPVVVFNNDLPETNFDRVLVNNRQAIKQATRYLIDMGHREIGFLSGDLSDSSARARKDGFIEEMRDHGLPTSENRIAGYGWSQQDGFIGAQSLFSTDNRPTAIIGSSYVLTSGAMQWFRTEGIAWPQDVSIISFDDVELFQNLDPGITAISQPVDEIAKFVATFLVTRLSGEHDGEGRIAKLRCQLVQRGSVRKNGSHGDLTEEMV